MNPLPSRRSVLRAMGAASIVSSAAVATSAVAYAGPPATPSRGGHVPADLLPGGAFDRLVAQQAAADVFSGTVLLAHRGRTVLSRSHGMADQQKSIPNRTDTIFNLGSITKAFTGLAISQLVFEGKMAYHEKLGTYLDGFPAGVADTVTIHQLLTHTSGIGRPATGNGAPPGGEWDSVEEVWDETLGIIRQIPETDFIPGTSYAYSNDGYWVLGAIVAAVSEQPFFEYVRQHILTPAEMSRTDFYTRPQVLGNPDIAHPYWTQPSGDRVDFTTTPQFKFVDGPDTGLYSTASDLFRFITALRSGKLLDLDFLSLATGSGVPVAPRDPGLSHWFVGYGFMHDVFGRRHIFTRSGGGPGRATRLDDFQDLDWVAVVLSNYDDKSIDAIVTREREIITQE
ncbi:serine hydrolase domain-containing protein [Jiangella asiatica]|uniref:Class A beta-lactamase-related serine hydrolase n=1 Tax=Jiangella asiatica TaxID=2530372 RepID=A0A4V2YYY7_9ACTN|nr:serine hydrolase domain-containing protein [Jiangella asiatica]TDD95017.1 class A beta-lactamase-related serine hydrolase [Jiangella asiatica]